MSYEVVISDDAFEVLAKLPIPVANALEQQINRVAQDPIRLSRPSCFPWPAGQSFDFEFDFESKRYYLTPIFKFGQDERQIHIIGIGNIIMPLP
jgi:hypothetical protein